jgi:hypothetical protein
MKKALAMLAMLAVLAGDATAQWEIAVKVVIPQDEVAVTKVAVDRWSPLTTNVPVVVTNKGVVSTGTVTRIVAETDRAKLKRILADYTAKRAKLLARSGTLSRIAGE